MDSRDQLLYLVSGYFGHPIISGIWYYKHTRKKLVLLPSFLWSLFEPTSANSANNTALSAPNSKKGGPSHRVALVYGQILGVI